MSISFKKKEEVLDKRKNIILELWLSKKYLSLTLEPGDDIMTQIMPAAYAKNMRAMTQLNKSE